MDHVGTMRKPTWGIVPSRGEVRVRVDHPIDIATEAPLLIASASEGLAIKQVMVDGVLLENTVNKPIMYALVVVPRVLVEAAKTPWKELWRESPLRQLWERLRNGEGGGPGVVSE